jgi:hypothetical protein
MARDIVDADPVESRDALVSWLEAGCKPAASFRVGTEHEKIPFYRADLAPVPYEGERGIRALLEETSSACSTRRAGARSRWSRAASSNSRAPRLKPSIRLRPKSTPTCARRTKSARRSASASWRLA